MNPRVAIIPRVSLITQLPQPQKVFIGVTSARGQSQIDCFDKCLIKLGLGNSSLVKITSILPPNIEIVTSMDQIEVPVGVNIPAVYTSSISDIRNEEIAVAIAIGKTTNGPSLVAECSGRREEAVREAVRADLSRMASSRSTTLSKRIVKSTECKVKKVTCTLAIVAEIAF